MSEKKRIDGLDMAKGVGIILMVAGHLVGSLQTIDNKSWFSPFYQFVASFHMPLFFILSGIVLAVTGEEEKPMKTVVCRKARTLLLPYASFSLIYMVINLCTCILHPELLSFSDLWKYLIYSVTFRGISVLWFLPTLFFGELFFIWCRRRLPDARSALVFLAAGFLTMFFSPLFRWEGWEENLALMAVGALMQTAARSLLVSIFLLAGSYAALLFRDREKRSFWGLLSGAALLAACAFLCFQNGAVDLNYMVFDNFILYVLCACCGSFGVILLCKNLRRSRLLTFLGIHSLVIMATHMEFKVMYYAIRFSYWLNRYVTRVKVWILFLTMALFILLAEAGIVWLYDRYLYFLLGKKAPAATKEGRIKQ